MAGPMYGYMGMPYPAPLGPSMRQRILRALQGGPCHGQTELLRILKLPADQLKNFNGALRIAISDGEVIETKRQIPGTGHDGPPVFEYTYTYNLPKGVKP